MNTIEKNGARQGDVIAIPAIKPEGCVEMPREGGSVVLAHGEVTGHMHQFRGANVAMFRHDDTGHEYLTVKEPEALTHEEHDTIVWPAGDYELGQQVEFAPAELRNVAD